MKSTPYPSRIASTGLPGSPSAHQHRDHGHISDVQSWLSGPERRHKCCQPGSHHITTQTSKQKLCATAQTRARIETKQQQQGKCRLACIDPGSGKYITKVPLSLPPGPVDLPPGCAFGLWLNCRYLNAAWVSLLILRATL